MSKALPAVWQGSYQSLPAAQGPGFDSREWFESCRRRVAGPASPPDDSSGFLTAALALALARRKRARVLDFGGGPGATFRTVAAALAPRVNLDYRIVDNPKVCRVGRARFRSDPRVLFHTELPTLSNVDIVHAQSSLQYVEDWPGLLHALASYRAPTLAITDLPAGAFRTYAAHQNYYGSSIPCWFFNLAAFVREAKRNGYQLAARTRYLGSYFGRYQDMPQANYPPRMRVGKSWNLLFTRP